MTRKTRGVMTRPQDLRVSLEGLHDADFASDLSRMGREAAARHLLSMAEHNLQDKHEEALALEIKIVSGDPCTLR